MGGVHQQWPTAAFVVDQVFSLREVATRYRWAEAAFPGDRCDLAARPGVAVRTLYRKLSHHE